MSNIVIKCLINRCNTVSRRMPVFFFLMNKKNINMKNCNNWGLATAFSPQQMQIDICTPDVESLKKKLKSNYILKLKLSYQISSGKFHLNET